MHTASIFPDNWVFDWRSAVIGALVAWLLAIFVYTRRDALRRLGKRAWTPMARWRTRLQRSAEEKYLLALRKELRTRLLFEPTHPELIFVPPSFLALPPLPNTFTEEFDAEAWLRVPYAQLLDGHSKVLLTGYRGSGRTTALVASLWHLISASEEESTPFTHFPLWIDLSQLDAISPDEDEEEKDVLKWLTELSAQSFPPALPKWLASQVQDQPTLILIDNWEALAGGLRPQVARRIGDAAERLPDSHWLVATGSAGYGPLVEQGFVPADIQSPNEQEAIRELYDGWVAQMDEGPPQLEEEIEHVLFWALETGDSLAELSLRIWLYLQTEEAPYRLHDTLKRCIDQFLPQPDLGEEHEETAQNAREAAQAVLRDLAWRSRMDAQVLSLQEIKEDLLAEQLPPPEERPSQLESTAIKLLQNTEFLDWENKKARFSHQIWEDLWLAYKLADMEDLDILREHLHDPNWAFVLECYIGIAKAQALVASLLKTGMKKDVIPTLLRSARWAILAPAEVPWRKSVMKVLAKIFIKAGFDLEERFALGKALSLVAEENAKPFFLQVLRHPDTTVRAAALHGLGWTGGPRDMQTLAAGLNEEAVEVQTSAVRALGDLGTPGAYRFLKDRLTEADEQLMLVIAETLAEDPAGQEALKEAVEAEDLLVRRAAVHGISQIDAPWKEEILERLMRDDPQWLVRSAAEAALSAGQTSTETLTVQPPPKLDEAAWLITWAAQQGLGVGVGDAALQMLLRTLEAEDPEARHLGCVTLARIGRPEHLPTLISLLEGEQNADVREAAEEAKQQIETRYQNVDVDETEAEAETESQAEETTS